jgi:hypothetical protein
MTQYFAQLDDNAVVTQVIVAGQDFINGLDGTWIETAMDGSIRKNYAGIGYLYHPSIDAFSPAQCHPEAVLNNDTALWDCANEAHTPKEMPNG